MADVLETELAELMPMPTAFDGYVERAVRVSSTGLVSVGRNRYSVPCEFASRRLSRRMYPTRIKNVAPGALRNDWPLQICQRRCVNSITALHVTPVVTGSWRKSLAAVPVAGPDAVLVAVELVLESGSLRCRTYPECRATADPPLPHRRSG